MQTYSRTVMALILCLLITAGVPHALAQATAGTFTGIVIDQSEAAVPGVTVTLKNTATNIVQTKQTAENGRYSFSGLSLGSYELEIALRGFNTVSHKNIELTLNPSSSLTTVLTPATVVQSVDVKGGPPLINTTDSIISAIFGQERVTDLPDPGLGNLGGGVNDVFSNGLSVAGVGQINQGNMGAPTGTDYAANGNRLRSNAFAVDGQDITDPTSTGRQLPMNIPDAVQQFRMITNQPSAEYGRASGAIVSVATKSGTNLLHGSVFWFHNSNSFNSRSNLDKSGGFKNAPLRIENQFGGTIGGPIVRNRTFFFGSLQRWTDRNLFAGTTIISAPTEEGRAVLQAHGGTRVTTQALLENLPAATGGRSNTIRYCFNPANTTGAPPAPTLDPGTGQYVCGPPAAPVAGWSVFEVPVGTFNNSNLIRYNDWQGSSRVDHTFNTRHSIYARYMFNDDLQTGIGQATPPDVANIAPSRSQAATIGFISALSPTFQNELRASWSRYAFYTGPQNPKALRIPSIEITTDLLLTGATSVAPRKALGYPTNLPEGRRSNIYQFADSMTWTHGSHTTKWGVDIRKQDMASESQSNVRGQLRYANLTTFVADFASLAAINRTLPGGEFLTHFGWTDLFFFAQDDWKVARDFTLNLGLRYELPGNAIESLYPLNDRIVAANGGDSLFRYNSRPPRDKNNFMPRFGFNWNIGGKDSMVLRGGYARTNDYSFLIMSINTASSFPFQGGGSAPNRSSALANLSTFSTALPMLGQTLLSEDFRTPYSDQYSLEIQRALSVNNVVRLGYVGTKGTGLFQSQEGNPTTRCGAANCARVDPTRGSMRVRSNTGSSIYHSMQVSFDHRFSRNLSGGAHYTWSAFIDNGSDPFNPSTAEVATPQDPFNRSAGERARSTYDRPHRLTGNVVYELPFMKTRPGAMGRIAGGWQVGTLLTFQSGSPFTVLNGTDPFGVLAGSLIGIPMRPNFAPGVDIEALRNMGVAEIRRRVVEAGNTSVFFRAAQSPGGPTATAPIGDVPRNFLRSDGLVSIDVNIVKNIRFGDRTLQLRADMFNFPNTRNFGIPSAQLGGTTSDFLNEGATDAGNRRIFLSLRYRF